MKAPRRTKAEIEAERLALAEAEALEKSPEYQAQHNAELAELCKKWRAKAEMPISRAAQILGMSKRTYEGIEQGRGFGYSKLLALAIKAFD